MIIHLFSLFCSYVQKDLDISYITPRLVGKCIKSFYLIDTFDSASAVFLLVTHLRNQNDFILLNLSLFVILSCSSALKMTDLGTIKGRISILDILDIGC